MSSLRRLNRNRGGEDPVGTSTNTSRRNNSSHPHYGGEEGRWQDSSHSGGMANSPRRNTLVDHHRMSPSSYASSPIASSPSHPPRRRGSSPRIIHKNNDANKTVPNPYNLSRSHSGSSPRPNNNNQNHNYSLESPSSSSVSSQNGRNAWNQSPSANNNAHARTVAWEADRKKSYYWKQKPPHDFGVRSGSTASPSTMTTQPQSTISSPSSKYSGSAEPSGNYFREGGRSAEAVARILEAVRSSQSGDPAEDGRPRRHYEEAEGEDAPTTRQDPTRRRLGHVHEEAGEESVDTTEEGASVLGILVPGGKGSIPHKSIEELSVMTDYTGNNGTFYPNATGRSPFSSVRGRDPMREQQQYLQQQILQQRKRKQNQPTSRVPSVYSGEQSSHHHHQASHSSSSSAQERASPPLSLFQHHQDMADTTTTTHLSAVGPPSRRLSPMAAADPPMKVPQRRSFQPRSSKQQPLERTSEGDEICTASGSFSKGQDPDATIHNRGGADVEASTPRHHHHHQHHATTLEAAPSTGGTLDPPTASAVSSSWNNEPSRSVGAETATPLPRQPHRQEVEGETNHNIRLSPLGRPDAPEDSHHFSRSNYGTEYTPVSPQSQALERLPSVDPNSGVVILDDISVSPTRKVVPKEKHVVRRYSSTPAPRSPPPPLLKRDPSIVEQDDMSGCGESAMSYEERLSERPSRDDSVCYNQSESFAESHIQNDASRDDEYQGSVQEEQQEQGEEGDSESVYEKASVSPSAHSSVVQDFDDTHHTHRRSDEMEYRTESDAVPRFHHPVSPIHAHGSREERMSQYSADENEAKSVSASESKPRSHIGEASSEDPSLMGASTGTVDLNEFIFPDNSIVEDVSDDREERHFDEAESQPEHLSVQSSTSREMGMPGIFCCGNIEDEKHRKRMNHTSDQSEVEASSSDLRHSMPGSPSKGQCVQVLETIEENDSEEPGTKNSDSSSTNLKKSFIRGASLLVETIANNSAVASCQQDTKEHSPFPLVFAKETGQKNDDMLKADRNRPFKSSAIMSAESLSVNSVLTDADFRRLDSTELSPTARLDNAVFSDASSWVDEEDEHATNTKNVPQSLTPRSTNGRGRSQGRTVANVLSDDVNSTASTQVQGNLKGNREMRYPARSNLHVPTRPGEGKAEVPAVSSNVQASDGNEPKKPSVASRFPVPSSSYSDNASQQQSEDWHSDSPGNPLAPMVNGMKDTILNKDDHSVDSNKEGSVGDSTAFFDAEEEGSLASFVSLEAILSMSPRSSLLQLSEEMGQGNNAYVCASMFSPAESNDDSAHEGEESLQSSFLNAIQKGIGDQSNLELKSCYKSMQRGATGPCSPSHTTSSDDDALVSCGLTCADSTKHGQVQHHSGSFTSSQEDSKKETEGAVRIAAIRRRELMRRKRLKQLYSSLGEKKQSDSVEPGNNTTSIGNSTVPPQTSSIDANIRAIMLQSRAVVLQKNVRRMLAVRTHRRTTRAAILIQCAVRKVLSQILLSRKKEEYRNKTTASTRIQTYVRMIQAIQKLEAAKRIRHSAIVIQAHYRGHLAIHEFQFTRSCAILIQAHVRRLLRTEKYRAMKTASVFIQRNIRMVQAVEMLLLSKLSTIFIQRNYRRWLAIKRFEIAKDAAVTIQSLYRRSTTLRSFLAVKRCIIYLQASWRRFYIRRNFNNMLSSVVVLQSLVRARGSRKVFLSFRMSVVALQARARSVTATRIYSKLLSRVIRIQTFWRCTHARKSYARTLAGFIAFQGLARILLARGKAWIRWFAIVTIQSFERRRQAQKALRAAKIVWQIETAFSNSTNPATVPANLLQRGESNAVHCNSVLAHNSNSLVTSNTSKTGDVDMELNSMAEMEMDVAASTMELEDQIPPGCPQIVAGLLNGERPMPARVDSSESNSLVSVRATRTEPTNNMPNCNPMPVCTQASVGSVSIDESVVPTRVYSDHSTTGTQDEMSTKDFSMSTKGHSSSAFTSAFASASPKTASLATSFREGFKQILQCANSEDDLGGSGSASGEEISTVGETARSTKKKSDQNERDLGGIKIVFADTVEYSDTAELESKTEAALGKGEENSNEDETRQTSDEATMDDTTIRENDTNDSSVNDTESHRQENRDSQRPPLVDDDCNGVNIGDFLESTIDLMCLSPGGVSQFFPLSPQNMGAECHRFSADCQNFSSQSWTNASGDTKPRRQSKNPHHNRNSNRPGKRSSEDKTYRAPSPRVNRRMNEKTNYDRALVHTVVEKSRLPPQHSTHERSGRNTPRSSRSAFHSGSGSKFPPSSPSPRRTSGSFSGNSRNVRELSFEERTIQSSSPGPEEWKGRRYPAFHRTPVDATASSHGQDSDLTRNDELFHLLANMLLEYFQSKLNDGGNSIIIKGEDKPQIELLLPGDKRDSFVEAARNRVSTITSQASSLHPVLMKCQELGFDREGESNPILSSRDLSNEPIIIDLTSQPQTMEVPPSPPTEGSDEDKNNRKRVVADGLVRSVKEQETVDSELTRQQLTAELREATNLMTDSENPETSLFWRNHVLDLQNRLLTIQGEDKQSHTHPDEILERNHKLLSEFQNREQYSPPSYTESQQEAVVPSTQDQHHHTSIHDNAEDQSRMVDVISPADLPGGYHFEAEIEGQRFLATVPPCGVRQGETFTSVMRELDSVAIDIPVAYWKDGMTSACKHGCCHPSIWNAIFCPLIALAQIGQRIQLDFLGRPQHPQSEHPYYSNRTMMSIVIIFWFMVNCGLIAGCVYKWKLALEVSFADYSALALINVAMVGFTIFVTQSTRYSLREKFLIREERCYDLEDVVCSIFCLPCVVCQMQRHTANYNEHDAVCCSKTGLPDGVGLLTDNNPEKSSAFIV